MPILKQGTPVEFVQPNLKGSIVKTEIIDDGIQYLVEYTNDEGDTHQRWFKETEIQEV